ncbi:MAG: hypothetical protein HY939_00315 [Gammaproteobacteria bacterium]|nr:hypothetical protein [Gammaproteobacteria bacterium]
MKNFSSHIKKLKKHMTMTGEYFLRVGSDDAAWAMIYCPQKPPPGPGRYYAMSMAGSKCIPSGNSCIRQAYRIDPNTGEPETVKLDTKGQPFLKGTDNEPRVFAVKQFSTQRDQTIALNEAKVLAKHQFVDLSQTNLGQPIIISDFHPGSTICNTAGKPNEKVLGVLSLKDRLALILQIVNQYHDIQAESYDTKTQKYRKKPHVHADIKGSNVIIYAPQAGSVNAMVIDFGSAKVLDENGRVETGIGGLTQSAIPPEAVESGPDDYVSPDRITGFLNAKSDIYEMGPVFAALLGAQEPYSCRQDEIQDRWGFSLPLLKEQIERGFNFEGLLDDKIPNIGFEFHIKVPCGFVNQVSDEAPKDRFILANEAYPELGYVLFKNQLLYIDKTKNKVYGRKPGGLSQFKKDIEGIRDLPNTTELNSKELKICMGLSNFHSENKMSLDVPLRELIKNFLVCMVENEHEKRPSMAEVLKFFTIANKIAAIASTPVSEGSFSEIERRLQIGLIQLNIILYKGWNIQLPVIGLKGEAQTTSPLSMYDFDALESLDESVTTLVKKLFDVFSKEEILDGREPLNADHFGFLIIPSEAKKIADAIKYKLTSQGIHIDESLIDKVLIIFQREPAEFSEKANVFLSLPPLMMQYLLTGVKPKQFTEDIKTKRIFVEHKKFIKEYFPDQYRAVIEAGFSSTESGLEKLIENPEASDVLRLLTCNLDDENEIAKFLKPQVDEITNTYSEEKLFDLLSDIESNKNNIITVTSSDTYLKLRQAVAKPLLKEIRNYLEMMDKIDNKNKYRVSFFGYGGSGYKVGEKIDAAKALITAIETGDYAVLLTNKAVIPALKQKTLGKLSKPLLTRITTSLKESSASKVNKSI